MESCSKQHTGYAFYNALTLCGYDTFVHRFSNRFIWRCRTQELLALYQRNVSACHLDAGVGTGYFLDRVKFPMPRPAITLLDANPHCLAKASERIARYEPRVVEANLLDPVPVRGPFASVGLCYLLHCVPGSLPAKAVVLDHLKTVMAPAARIFGASIVQGSVPRSWPAQRLLDFYNRIGMFSNTDDTVENLQAALASRFQRVELSLRGNVALFQAQRDG